MSAVTRTECTVHAHSIARNMHETSYGYGVDKLAIICLLNSWVCQLHFCSIWNSQPLSGAPRSPQLPRRSISSIRHSETAGNMGLTCASWLTRSLVCIIKILIQKERDACQYGPRRIRICVKVHVSAWDHSAVNPPDLFFCGSTIKHPRPSAAKRHQSARFRIPSPTPL